MVPKDGVDPYGGACVKFAFASAFRNGKIHMLSDLRRCRELVCQDFMKRVRNSWTSETTQKEIDIRRCRIIIQYPAHKATESRLNTTVQLIRTLEKHAGWPLTKIYELETTSIKNKHFLFTASSKWHRTQYFLSMYLLLLRVFTNAPSVYCSAKKVEDFEKIIKSKNVAGYMKVLPDFVKIMENFDSLTKGLPLRELYSAKEMGASDVAFARGIQFLIGGKKKIQRSSKFKIRIADLLDR
jgi:hypothetical protein